MFNIENSHMHDMAEVQMMECVKSNLLLSERDEFFYTLIALETDLNLKEEVGLPDEDNIA